VKSNRKPHARIETKVLLAIKTRYSSFLSSASLRFARGSTLLYTSSSRLPDAPLLLVLFRQRGVVLLLRASMLPVIPLPARPRDQSERYPDRGFLVEVNALRCDEERSITFVSLCVWIV
jgi:hypothetical protein